MAEWSRGSKSGMVTLRPHVTESPMTELRSRKQRDRLQETGTEMRVPRRVRIRGSLLSGRRRSCCGATHQLSAIRPLCGDSDLCVPPGGSAPGTCTVASNNEILRKDSRVHESKRTFLARSQRWNERQLKCKIASFRVREARYYRYRI